MLDELMIIDGYSLAYRAGHVLHLSTDTGKDTSVIYGVLKMIRSLIEEYQPKAVCICWDYHGSAAKEKVFPDYKKHRKALDWEKEDDREKIQLARAIRAQIDDLCTIVPMMGMLQLRKDGIEGDDLIGLLTECLEGSILVVSSDKDIFQLLRPNLSIYYPPKDVVLDILNFESEMGLNYTLWLDYRCIVGDTTDGIPGLPTFGDVTAKRILKAFGGWRDWWIDDRVRPEVLGCCNKRQKLILLSREARAILERNFEIMKLGHLVQDEKAWVLTELKSQTLQFDDEIVHRYFEENQLKESLIRFGIWVHTFRELTRR